MQPDAMSGQTPHGSKNGRLRDTILKNRTPLARAETKNDTWSQESLELALRNPPSLELALRNPTSLELALRNPPSLEPIHVLWVALRKVSTHFLWSLL